MLCKSLYWNFSNIRYAAPPTGQLRFLPPTDPLYESGVNNGSVGYICPQAPPGWFTQANADLGNLSKVIPPGTSSQSQSEDCLFLDVIVPKKVYENRSKRLVPVLVNIHGGGYFIGEKRLLYPPNGLLSRSNASILYVSISYRVCRTTVGSDSLRSWRLIDLSLGCSVSLHLSRIIKIINPQITLPPMPAFSINDLPWHGFTNTSTFLVAIPRMRHSQESLRVARRSSCTLWHTAVRGTLVYFRRESLKVHRLR